jgi:hypothetical protein
LAVYHLDSAIEFDFELVGISSHEKDFRLCWALNKALGWNLVRMEDVVLDSKDGESSHARFVYVDPANKMTYTLIENTAPEGTLIPEKAQFDFLLLIESNGQEVPERLYRELRKVSFVLAAFPLMTDKLKSKQNLIFS